MSFRDSIKQGLVVQLVRIHACHAWGRGFESRPDRKNWEALWKQSAFLPKKAYEMHST
jgi:putative component of membrane protein insertase Oxa1/YidC/SpoIIIJ protein YidD